ncbi:MAG: molybdopterin dinucleotide binding domain-containing protein, partial [Candidatus Bathyarchaeia archaeon]
MPFYSLIKAGCTTWGEQSYSGDGNAEILSTGTILWWSPVTSSESDIFNSKLILLVGRLPTVVEGQGGVWGYMTLRAKEAGIPFILIDPRYTVTHKMLNAQWIPIRPGTDLALLLAMAYVLFEKDLYDHAFVDKWVEPKGFALWKDYVTGVSDGTPKNPEWAEEKCGVPAETTQALAELYAKSKPTRLLMGWEMNRPQSTSISRVAIALQAMMGYLFMPGGGSPFEFGYGKNPWPTGPMPTPVFAAPPPDNSTEKPYDVPTLMNILTWQKAVHLREQFDAGKLTAAEYNGLIGNKADNPNPNIKMVGFCDNQPANRFGANERLAACKKVFTWGRYWYINNSSLYMDMILPAVESVVEEPASMFGGSRFLSNWADLMNFFTYSEPAITPQGETRPDEWIWLMLAKRAGVDQKYNPTMASILDKDEWDVTKWNNALEEAHKKGYEQWREDPQVKSMNPPTWEEFKKKPVWRFDASETGPFQLWMDQSTNPFEYTESGKLELHSSTLADPAKAANTDICGGRNYFPYMYARIYFGKIGPGATAIPTWRDKVEHTFYDPKSDKYPLVVISPESYYRSHSSNFLNPYLNGDCYKHRVWISAADAKARGIVDNDLVRVYSDVGEMIIPAYVTSRMTPGVVAIYHGGFYIPGSVKTALQPDGIDRSGNMNLLTVDQQPGTMVIGPCIGSGP